VDHLIARVLALAFAVACAGHRPAPSEPVEEPAMSGLPPFSCESAAAHLGLPGAEVGSCRRFEPLDVYSLFLKDASLPEGGAVFHVAVRGGAPIAERGNAAVARFLRDARVWDHPELDIRDVGVALRALDGFPHGYDFDAVGFEVAGVGESHLAFRPFRLTLFRPLVPGSDGGAPAPMRFERAVLAADARTTEFTWTIAHQEHAGGPFVGESTYALD